MQILGLGAHSDFQGWVEVQTSHCHCLKLLKSPLQDGRRRNHHVITLDLVMSVPDWALNQARGPKRVVRGV